MPVGILIHASDADEELYERVREELNWHDGPYPEGFVSHYAGPDPGGGWFIFDVWESKGHYERFAQERLTPVFERVVGSHAAPPEPTFIEIVSSDHAGER